MNLGEKNSIFISYSNHDRVLFTSLKVLLERFILDLDLGQVDVCGMGDMPDSGGEDNKWREQILGKIKGCCAFIALYTVNSSESNWVHYEIGYAQGCDKNIQVLCTQGVEIDKSILRENQWIDLSLEIDGGQISTNCIQKLLSGIFGNHKDYLNPLTTRYIQDWVNGKINADKHKTSTRELMANFIYNCNVKQIYIAGNNPTGEPKQDSNCEPQGIWNEENQKKVDEFVGAIVDKLSENSSEFVFSSFPSVKHVGAVVMSRLVERSNAERNFDISRHYSISGLYKMDKESGDILANVDQTKWNELIRSSRLDYLKRKDCMIIIGGSNNTKDEYEASRAVDHLQVFPIPCFGGTGKECYEQLIDNDDFTKFEHPCQKCKTNQVFSGISKCPFLQDINVRLSKYKNPLDKIH